MEIASPKAIAPLIAPLKNIIPFSLSLSVNEGHLTKLTKI